MDYVFDLVLPFDFIYLRKCVLSLRYYEVNNVYTTLEIIGHSPELPRFEIYAPEVIDIDFLNVLQKHVIFFNLCHFQCKSVILSG